MFENRQYWLKHIRADRVITFPRDYGLWRRKLYTTQQFLTACEHAHNNRLELFTSVLSDYEIANQIVTELFYDIDVDHVDTSKLLKTLNNDTLESLVHEYSSGLQGNLRERRDLEGSSVVSNTNKDVGETDVDGRSDTSTTEGSGLRNTTRRAVQGLHLVKADEVKSIVSYTSKDKYRQYRLSNISSRQSINEVYSRQYINNPSGSCRLDVVELIVRLESIIKAIRTVYSGRRGIHLHIDLEPIRVTDLRRAAEYTAELLGIADYVDKQVLGDWRRLSRVPGSFHRISGSECVYINPSTNPELTRLLSEVLHEKFTHKVNNYVVPLPSETREKVTVLGEPPPCISYLIGRLVAGQDISHAGRLHLGAYLMRIGLTPDEASILYSKCSDFAQTTTYYHLQWLSRHNYKMYSCEKARMYGLCPLPADGCKYFPSPNWFLG